MLTRNLPFLRIESVVIRTKILSANEKWLYIVIKSFRNRKSKLCCPSLKRIVEKAELRKATVLRCRKKLRTIGLISWEEQTGWKKSTRYRFTLEDGSEQEITRVLGNLQMVRMGTIVDGLKGNQPLVKKGTIYGLDEKRGSEAEAESDSNDSLMVQTGTLNHINQMKRTRSIDGTASHPSPQNGDAQPVPEKPEEKFIPMPEATKKALGLKKEKRERVDEGKRREELLKQVEHLEKKG